MPIVLARAALLAVCALALGCDRGGTGGSSAVDTAGGGGLSREQLEQQAQPMSREQAEQLGIVDTTEAEQPSPVSPDAAAPVARPDTSAPPSP